MGHLKKAGINRRSTKQKQLRASLSIWDEFTVGNLVFLFLTELQRNVLNSLKIQRASWEVKGGRKSQASTQQLPDDVSALLFVIP